MSVGDIIVIIVLAFILFLAIAAAIQGRKGLRMSKEFSDDKKVQWGYWLLSFLHFGAGILIIICYLIVLILIISNIPLFIGA